MTFRLIQEHRNGAWGEAEWTWQEKRPSIDEMIDVVEREFARIAASERAFVLTGWRPRGPNPEEMRKKFIFEALAERLIAIKGCEKEIVAVLSRAKRREAA